ncbi:ParB/RepB/Spo0J family partition protein [Delftia sp.]|uniref:ParB/RepB/Spo0J family partition protein n=1 Tax=Delftia sp. TaxID=1886637 RepID=UPI00259C8206|nr:ParB/RepB/Spo0J family partition protein [Delftia sp.]
MTSTAACKACAHWLPDTSDPRMVRLGFAQCARHLMPGRTFNADSRCDKFSAMPADQLAARREVAVQRVRQLKAQGGALMAPKTKDPLIQREVVISTEATGKGGKPHPQAGQRGKVIGKTPGGRQYQIAVGDSLVNLPMDAFEVVQAEREDSADAGAIVHPTLPLAQIAPSRTNRMVVEDDALHDMAATMKLYGVLQPLLLRRLPAERLQDTFEDEATRRATHEIIAGERRYRAAQIAGLRAVPYIERDADNMHALLMQLIENLHRSDLTPLQEALGVQRLTLDHGFSIDGAAEALHKSRTHVFESLRLLTLCPEATAGLAARTLTRSVALLVAQRPTEAIQTEYTKRVLTGGPDGGPMSYRSALDLARRSYMLKLDQAPFALDDATLCPDAGACSVCPKHTGASPELWDKNDADVCTDTACFAEKKDAHFERMKAQAQQRGQQIITGRQARDIMPSENGAPRGYLLLDKPSQGSSAPVRQVLGQDVPAASVVLIEAPSGNLVEAVPTHTASAAVKVKGERQAAAKAQARAADRAHAGSAAARVRDPLARARGRGNDRRSPAPSSCRSRPNTQPRGPADPQAAGRRRAQPAPPPHVPDRRQRQPRRTGPAGSPWRIWPSRICQRKSSTC